MNVSIHNDGLQEERMYFCGVNYREENYKMQDSQEETDMDLPAASRRIEESVRVLEDEGVELINIPVPKFSDSDPADIVHDFNRVRAKFISLTKPYIHRQFDQIPKNKLHVPK